MAEPISTTGASYVEPSAQAPLKPGQRIARLFPRSVLGDYVLQRLTARTYWFSRHFYGTVFYVGDRGVLLLDPIMGAADSLLAAIASVTPLPVTAICYSHFHTDHIGGARRLERRRAVEAAVPRIMERLRPKYGRMYGFDDAQPINIRLLAMSMQPSLENR